jgi:hypothetical protein
VVSRPSQSSSLSPLRSSRSSSTLLLPPHGHRHGCPCTIIATADAPWAVALSVVVAVGRGGRSRGSKTFTYHSPFPTPDSLACENPSRGEVPPLNGMPLTSTLNVPNRRTRTKTLWGLQVWPITRMWRRSDPQALTRTNREGH